MTTLEAIGFTIAGGTAVLGISFGLFGSAVARRHPFVAPRATNRPPDVIFNPHPQHACQDRGGPMFGWIRWVLALDYDTMLRGVPGTGTRNNGMEGSLLRVTLDSVVLIRFHSLAMRVSALASVLLLVFIMPMYISAQCYRLSDGEAQERPGCASVTYNLTNYERTTIANVPSLSDANAFTTIVNAEHNGIVARLYFVVFCFWIINGYLLQQLKKEWIQLLAMRRVYYLESDVWEERREELKSTLLFEERAKSRRHHLTSTLQPVSREQLQAAQDTHLTKREPWIPHPEQRDTVPNVALYSLLVGGLPSLPQHVADQIDEAVAQFSKRESIDWQLSITSTFFDHCVPNQPGFSSSVAAVTIIPGANELSVAWRKWYAAAAKLRRLRFIRQQIAERRHFEIEDDEDEDMIDTLGEQTQFGPLDESETHDETGRPIYRDESKNQAYLRQVLGTLAVEDFESNIYRAFGPEQTAVYSREFAQSAALCCPNGFNEERVRTAGIDELLEIEREAAEEVHLANLELKVARQRATVTELQEGSFSNNEDDVEAVRQPPSRIASFKSSLTNFSGGSDPSRRKKKQRKSSIVETSALPTGLGLESQLYHRGSIHESQHAARRRRPNAEGAPHSWARPEPEQRGDLERGASLIQQTTQRDRSVDRILLPAAEYVEDEETGLKLRKNTSSQWTRVESIVAEAREKKIRRTLQGKGLSDGTWGWPEWSNFRSMARYMGSIVHRAGHRFVKKTKGTVEEFSRESTYAVVTFTSRQAAVAARYCLADGRGADRWMSVHEIPIPPLADAAACDVVAFRNFSRPVTLSINERQKMFRNYCAILMLGGIYFFYTIPLTLASSIVDSETLDEIFPRLAEWAEARNIQITQLVSGMLSALIWSAFFASCPLIFKAISNFGSKANSVANAEFKALQYFWWFMVVTAFSGQLLASMILSGFNDGLRIGSEFRSVVRAVALTVPSKTSASWLNWIIFRFTVILPLSYLLQANTFIFSFLGFHVCARVVRGGGPGGVTPYRLYVDSATVLMCVLALAPASPLVAPASFFYFLFCQPMLRRNAIFVYRPKYDGGGLRFPFMFDMVISSLIVAQILLTTQMALKQAVGPAIAAGMPIPFTMFFSHTMKARYLRAYTDAALLQTSLLDGWDTAEDTSEERREEFRRFLVDAHKAAYVPVCIAGTDTDDMLTAEPAVVVPLETDIEKQSEQAEDSLMLTDTLVDSIPEPPPPPMAKLESRASQHGATMRRAVQTLTAMRRRPSLGGFHSSSSVIGQPKAEHMPFTEPTSLGASLGHLIRSESPRNSTHTPKQKSPRRVVTAGDSVLTPPQRSESSSPSEMLTPLSESRKDKKKKSKKTPKRKVPTRSKSGDSHASERLTI